MKQIALIYPLNEPWMAQCMKGIQAFAQEQGGWRLLTSPPTLRGAEEIALNVGDLKDWPGDGVIAYVSDARETRDAMRLDIPVVSIGGTLASPGLNRVTVDHHAIGRLGAEHLLARGFKRLAFYGMEGPWYAAERGQGFVERGRESGVNCELYLQPLERRRVSWQKRIAPLQRWLATLQPPIAIMAVHDFRAYMVIEECQRLGLNVPHDVAVLGVDDNTILCESSVPKISSVSRNAWRHGYEAAGLLHKLMRRKATRLPRDIRIPPDGVVQRRSTDTLAVDDPHVSSAIHLMRDHLSENGGMEFVLSQVGISRRLLEKRFQETLQCTPYTYLCRLRVERARKLLAEPDKKKLHTVASACGFTSADHLARVFHRLTGELPSDYRQRKTGNMDP